MAKWCQNMDWKKMVRKKEEEIIIKMFQKDNPKCIPPFFHKHPQNNNAVCPQFIEERRFWKFHFCSPLFLSSFARSTKKIFFFGKFYILKNVCWAFIVFSFSYVFQCIFVSFLYFPLPFLLALSNSKVKISISRSWFFLLTIFEQRFQDFGISSELSLCVYFLKQT